MSDLAIKVEGLGKRYKIGRAQRHDTLRDRIGDARLFKLFKRRNGNGQSAEGQEQRAESQERSAKGQASGSLPFAHSSSTADTIWALKDVSFEIKRGEVVGIIGRNGAGKSTLLKILSRITEPTEGYADITGRIASLLEVGTGFQPELTGRENIFLNGSILGMKHVEIKKKFDEIVAFAEVEKFIDTPVKHYSSGMYVRLAFGVAAHLDPEILLVDEVLAVGDAAFQKKCLGKMGEVAREGRTVLFVSHNLGAVNKLCGSAILLENGCLELAGPTEQVVTSYLSSGAQFEGERHWSGADAPGTDKIRLCAVRVLDSANKPNANLDIRRPVHIEIEYDLLSFVPNVRVALRLLASDGTIIFTSADSGINAWDDSSRHPGRYTSRCEIPGNFLNVGQYLITVSSDIPFVQELFLVENCLNFHVQQTGSHSGRFPERWPGMICPKLDWQIERLDTHRVAYGGVEG